MKEIFSRLTWLTAFYGIPQTTLALWLDARPGIFGALVTGSAVGRFQLEKS
jgi:hypothetical protein